MRGTCGGTAQRTLNTGKATVKFCLVTNLDVVPGQAGIGTHGAPVFGGNLIVFDHGFDHIAGQRVGFSLLRFLDTGQVILRYIDGRLFHNFVAGGLDRLMCNHAGALGVCSNRLKQIMRQPPAACLPRRQSVTDRG